MLETIIRHFQGAESLPIPVDDVIRLITNLGRVDIIELHEVDMDPGIIKGMYRETTFLAANYDDAKTFVEISYSNRMSRCWKRLVACKELMHVLDKTTSKTRTVEDLEQLTLELVAPYASDRERSDQLKAENHALWAALHVLAPMSIIEELRPAYLAKTKPAYDIAYFLRIPETFVDILFSDTFAALREYYCPAQAA